MATERDTKKLWSPHKASLQRRRAGAAKPKFDFDKLLDDTAEINLSPANSPKKKKPGMVFAEAANKATSKNNKRLSGEAAALVAKLKNKHLSPKERAEIEIKLRTNEETRDIFNDVNYSLGKTNKLTQVKEKQIAEEEQLAQNLKEEEERVLQEQKEKEELERHKQEQKEKSELERKKMRQSYTEKVASELNQLRTQAEKAVTAVVENEAKKKEEEAAKADEDELTSTQHAIINSEESDVLRNLKEARLRNKAVES